MLWLILLYANHDARDKEGNMRDRIYSDARRIFVCIDFFYMIA